MSKQIYFSAIVSQEIRKAYVKGGGIVLFQEKMQGPGVNLGSSYLGIGLGHRKSLSYLTLLSHLLNGYYTSIVFLVVRNKLYNICKESSAYIDSQQLNCLLFLKPALKQNSGQLWQQKTFLKLEKRQWKERPTVVLL